MPDETHVLEIYRSEYSYLIGSAIVIITAGKPAGSTSIYAEAFVLLPDQDGCEMWAQRFLSQEFRLTVPEIVIDAEYLARFARESAEAWLDSHTWEIFRTSEERVTPNRAALAMAGMSELVSLRLRGKCSKRLTYIKNVTLNEHLENVLHALRTIAVAKQDSLRDE